MMKKNLLLLITISAIAASGFAQPVIEWQASFGGSLADGFDNGNVQHEQVSVTPDGGYIFTGYSKSNDGDVTGHHGTSATADCWVVKLDSSGTLEWQRSLGGSQDELGYVVRPTADGGYIVLSSTRSNDGDVTGAHPDTSGSVFDFWVVKLDATGALEWQSAYGGTKVDNPYSLIQTHDGKYLAAGRTLSSDGDVTGNHGSFDIWLLMLDTTGAVLWQKCIGGTSAETAYQVREASDHGFLLCGTVSSSDGDFAGSSITALGSVFVMKTDSAGNVLWHQEFGGNSLEWGFEIHETPDGGYVLGSKTLSTDIPGHHGSSDFWLIKLDSAGALQWQQCYGGTASDELKSMQLTPDGGYVLAGNSQSADGDVSANNGSLDVWVLKTDSAGTIEWEKSYGGTGSDNGTSIVLTPDGGLLFCASSNSNDIDVSGHHGPLSESDSWVVKLSAPPTGIAEAGNPVRHLWVFPNPLQGRSDVHVELARPARVSLNFFDLQGRSVLGLADELLPAGPHTFTVDADLLHLRNGVYLLRLTTPQGTLTRKLSVIR